MAATRDLVLSLVDSAVDASEAAHPTVEVAAGPTFAPLPPPEARPPPPPLPLLPAGPQLAVPMDMTVGVTTQPVPLRTIGSIAISRYEADVFAETDIAPVAPVAPAAPLPDETPQRDMDEEDVPARRRLRCSTVGEITSTTAS